MLEAILVGIIDAFLLRKTMQFCSGVDSRAIALAGYRPGDLERQVAAFVEHYNHARYHESLDNLTTADVYFGRAETLLLERERIKRQTIANRRLQHQLSAA